MRHAIITVLTCLAFSSMTLLFVACEEPPQDAAAPAAEPELPPKPMPGDYVLIPAGEFKMGSDERPAGQDNKVQLWEPEHTVDVPAYEMSVFEVTNAEFARFQIESEYVAEGDWRRYYSLEKGDFPVANVTWDDANEYCEWAGGRLPTEAEWEKAARGPEGLRYPWGDEWSNSKSNCNEMGFRDTVEVGRMEPDKSGYGLFDMMGNVQEWTSEDLKPYPGNRNRGDVVYRRKYIVVRGGSYAMKGSSMTLWTRGGYLAKSQYGIGFRCAKDVEQPEETEN